MAKRSKFFRVAVEGATVDGRTIDRKWLTEAAANFNLATYAPRVNLEHIRGITADAPFQALGDVVALKTEDVDIVIGGKTERRVALFAQVDALAPLLAMHSKRQKLYPSIEVNPSFADSSQAYLMGLAMTDSPASLGTEMLEFCAKQGDKSPLAARKQQPGNFFSATGDAVDLEFDEVAEPSADPTGIFASLKTMLDRFGVKSAADPVVESVVSEPAKVDAPAAGDMAAIGVALSSMATAITKLANDQAAQLAAGTQLRTDIDALKTSISGTTAINHTARPLALGAQLSATSDAT